MIERPPVPTDERDRVIAELRYATRRFDWDVRSECAAAIVEWHLQSVAAARAAARPPGAAAHKDPLVERLLNRFQAAHTKNTIKRLTDETAQLKLQVLTAIACLSFYARGSTDGGARAKQALGKLRGDPDVGGTQSSSADQ